LFRNCWVAGAIIGLVACGPLGMPQARSASAPTATPSSVAVQQVAQLSEWQKRGATEVPPSVLPGIPLEGIAMVNGTNGELSDTDVKLQSTAFVRSLRYLLWAVAHMQDQFLERSGLSSAPAAVFRPNLNDIAAARQAGSRVEYVPQTIRRLVLRSVPPGLKSVFEDQRFRVTSYAFYIDAIGPAATVWIDARGSRTIKSQIAGGAGLPEVIGGGLSHDALLGDVWVLASDWDCSSIPTRRSLSPLCNP